MTILFINRSTTECYTVHAYSYIIYIYIYIYRQPPISWCLLVKPLKGKECLKKGGIAENQSQVTYVKFVYLLTVCNLYCTVVPSAGPGTDGLRTNEQARTIGLGVGLSLLGLIIILIIILVVILMCSRLSKRSATYTLNGDGTTFGKTLLLLMHNTVGSGGSAVLHLPHCCHFTVTSQHF